jgi:predicted O-methyltransferase YrrM
MLAETSIFMRLYKLLNEAAKAVAFRYTNLGAPTYHYLIEPIELATLINEFERVKDFHGNVVEIGVARGMTTMFLCSHIRYQKLENTLEYYAIDTFNSFKKSDLEFEVENRGKSLFELERFNYNDFDAWSRNFREFPFVKPVAVDCAVFDFKKIMPIKMAFLDVDLYLPTKNTLPQLYDCLCEGGVIVVDDIQNDTVYDGAYQAYMEFCESRGITPRIIGSRCGVIYK